MKNQNDSLTFQINDFKVKLDLISIDELIPHEEINESYLSKIINDINNIGFLKDPLIVDDDTLVVLDGMHRLAALKNLDCKFVPCMTVKYVEEKIKISKWIRQVSGEDKTIDISKVKNIISKYIDHKKIINFEINDLRTEFPKIKNILDENLFFLWGKRLVFIENLNINLNINIIKEFDSMFKNIRYISLYELEKEFDERTIYYSGRKVTKQEVINYARSGKLFPIKTTKHILPYRITNLRIPLIVLSSIEKEAAKQYLAENVKKRQFDIVPSAIDY